MPAANEDKSLNKPNFNGLTRKKKQALNKSCSTSLDAVFMRSIRLNRDDRINRVAKVHFAMEYKKDTLEVLPISKKGTLRKAFKKALRAREKKDAMEKFEAMARKIQLSKETSIKLVVISYRGS